MPTISLCFLVWNERLGCELQVPQVDLKSFDQVFAIDGGSSDGTEEVFNRLNIPVYTQKARGLNAAYWQAVEVSNCDYIVVFFPKGTLSVDILSQFKEGFKRGSELVIASRIVPGARNEEDDHLLKPRKWGIKCLAVMAWLLWRRGGPIIWDVLHGVKGFSKGAFLDMQPARTGISIDIEMTVRSYRLRVKAEEFPVTEVPRTYGSTRFKILPTSIKLAKYLAREMLRPRPKRTTTSPEADSSDLLAKTLS